MLNGWLAGWLNGCCERPRFIVAVRADQMRFIGEIVNGKWSNDKWLDGLIVKVYCEKHKL